jgi:nucleoside-diphosphate-sugar epimerase
MTRGSKCAWDDHANYRTIPPARCESRGAGPSEGDQAAESARAAPPRKILITGSSGLVGTALVRAMASRGVEITRLDITASGTARGDVRDRDRVHEAITGVHGVVHLAAVSRVVWGEREPALCWATNVGGLRNVLELAASASARPWIIFASSREVYGQPDRLPVTEDAPLRPVNVYGRSKLEGEQLVVAAQRDGVRACTIRLSNVFGALEDHADRVVPAFARAAALGRELRVDGADHTFDFTHIDDVTRGIVALAELLSAREDVPPPIHFVSGTPTMLGELAAAAIRIAGTGASVRHAPPRTFDVARFVGNSARARALLGWSPRVGLEEGLTRLIHAFRGQERAAQLQEAAL